MIRISCCNGVFAPLRDITRSQKLARQFADENNSSTAEFILAAGNAGIEAATNIVIKQAEITMLFLVYAIVGALVWWEFRSWRVTL